jgi:amino acid adenylation domain-containing protein
VVPSADDLAYVIYTSGSTGRPNGVQVTQHNIARLFTVTQPLYEFTPADVWSLFHSLAFDVSVFELWGALLSGGRLVVVPASIAKAADAFHALVLAEGVTVLSQTPSAFRAFDAADAAARRPQNQLRLVIFAGERLDPRTLKGWFDAHGDQRPLLANMYGITETTVHTTYRPTRARDAEGEGRSMIGMPLSDLRIELLDPAGLEVADGQVGEIWVGGAGVTAGYIERPELTARRFQPDPSHGTGALRYRSGDLARRLPDGDLEYLGRADEQIKLRGYRVELGEIEAMLRRSPTVRDAVVTLRDEPQLGPTLIAYIVSESSAAPEQESLRQYLQNSLPEYMVPTAFVRIAQVPRTVNDKIGRKALPAPSPRDFPVAAGPDGGGSAPRDDLEQTVAGIVGELLGRPATRRDSDFFALAVIHCWRCAPWCYARSGSKSRSRSARCSSTRLLQNSPRRCARICSWAAAHRRSRASSADPQFHSRRSNAHCGSTCSCRRMTGSTTYPSLF